MRRAIDGAAKPCDATVMVGSHRPAVGEVPGSAELRDLLVAAHRSLGEDVGATRSAAGGSSAFAGGARVPTIDGMGPVGGALMTDHEHVEVGSLGERATALALVLHRLAVRPPGRVRSPRSG